MIYNDSDNEMKVLKRSNTYEDISFDKILNRVKTLGISKNIKVNYTQLCLKVIDQLYDGIPTTKIDELTAEQCASMSTIHPDYATLASMVTVSNHHKNTRNSFLSVVEKLNEDNDYSEGLLSKTFVERVRNNHETYEKMINYDRDYLVDYFGFKTLERAYLMRREGEVIERPQHMWMRVAVTIHGDNFELVESTYDYMSRLVFTHATPTLFNAGIIRPQLSSCYLLAMEDDSIDGIFSTLSDCAQISKWAGGIGLHIHNVRCTGSHIKGTNGTSNGIVPMLRVFNNTARYVDQGGGKRNGSFAVYLEPHHGDIEEFLDLKKNHGDEEMRARDLFYALWISDYFMECVEKDDDWYLFCPHKAPGMSDVVGEDYKKLYNRYVSEGNYVKKIKARNLWFKILDSQMETGTPYILYKDSCNLKSNQKNLGVIKSSNLCTEIIEYSSPEETAVCNLASIALSKFVTESNTFNYDALHKVTKTVTFNLNKVIDINYYPTIKTWRSNMRHRPIGIGVQGLADVYFLMNVAYDSEEAKIINKNIFETIYHAALEQSNEIAMSRSVDMVDLKRKYDAGEIQMTDGKYIHNDESVIEEELSRNCNDDLYGTYSSFAGSPASEGVLQFDMWNVTPSHRYKWHELKENIKKYGLRNSLLVAPMPTASTSQILGNNECFEPITSNIYTRRTLAGEFVIINKYLMRELIDLGVWNEDLKNSIIANNGSVQHIDGLSEDIKNKYKIVWEMPMRHLIDMARDRGAYIDQSQSLNLWIEDPNYKILTSMHFYSWKQGLKTGLYYLRRKAKHQPQQFTIVPENSTNACENNDICEMCSS